MTSCQHCLRRIALFTVKRAFDVSSKSETDLRSNQNPDLITRFTPNVVVAVVISLLHQSRQVPFDVDNSSKDFTQQY